MHCSQLVRSSIHSVRRQHSHHHCRRQLLSFITTRSRITFSPIISNQQQQQQQKQQCRYHHQSSQTKKQRLTISRANHLLQTHQLTVPQLCTHAHNLATFGEHSLHLNAYVKLLPLDDVLYQATLSQERWERGQCKSRLDGLPVTIKANVAVGRWWGMPHSSSAILMDKHDDSNADNDSTSNNTDDTEEEEAVYESDIAKKLLNECGAVLIGITNMDEFGMGSLGLNSGVPSSSLLLQQHDDDDGTDSKQYQQHQQYCVNNKQYSNPIYNPLPWMHRLSMMPSHNQQLLLDDRKDDLDQYWIEQIQNSTIHNPHGISDQVALEELVDEIRYWTQSSQWNDDRDGNDDNNNNNRSMAEEASRASHSTTTKTTTTTSPLLASGGSSSGAATTIAHGSSLLSIGTDTGGSLRLPSAWTCTVGFKPTYGSFSRYGVVSYASSLDTVGFVTGSVECARIGWECLSSSSGGGEKFDNIDDDDDRSCVDFKKSRDATARVYHDDRYHRLLTSQQQQKQQQPTTTTTTDTTNPLANIRIGIPHAFSLHETPPLIANAWSLAANTLQNNIAGATLVSIPESVVSSEWIKLSCAAYYVLACAEASSNLSRYDGVRFGLDVDLNEFAHTNIDNLQEYKEYLPLFGMTALEEKISTTRVLGFGDEVQRRVLAGTSVLSSDRFHTHYEAAAIVRAKVSQSIERAFRSSSASMNDNNSGVDDDDTNDEKVDVMLVPTALSFPCTLNPQLGDRMMEDMDPTAAFGNDVMTIPISLGGFPSISVPFSTHNDDDDNSELREKDVVGLQVFGMRGSEDVVLQVADAMKNSC